uniref:GH18 domain-containing protein n=1 Tax=Dunaliella tertiolecta TaxID=3047 RepID=A0A7S3VJX5_DUNTE
MASQYACVQTQEWGRQNPKMFPMVWFSNSESLALRYQMAAELGLKGVGAWNLEHLFSRSEAGITAALAPAGGEVSPRELQMRAGMWQAVEAFFYPRLDSNETDALVGCVS